MKAVIATRYGAPDVLKITDQPKPSASSNEVLIRIYATTVNRTDVATLRAIPFFMRFMSGLFKPKHLILGSEFAGEIEMIGKDVSTFKVGDRVFGIKEDSFGTHAQYMTMPEDSTLATIPENISYEEAAASSEGAFYAYNFINKVNPKSRQKVLINGATGAIGSAGVQILKHLNVDITATCNSKHVGLVKSLGADHVIDYTLQDFTKSDQLYHYVFDMVGKSSFFKCKPLLLPKGVYMSSDLGFLAQNIYLPALTSISKLWFGNKKVIFPMPTNCKEIILFIQQLMQKNEFKTVIDKTYPLEEIVSAYNYVETGQKIGNVVITIP